jgi:hypothetical protein
MINSVQVLVFTLKKSYTPTRPYSTTNTENKMSKVTTSNVKREKSMKKTKNIKSAKERRGFF